MAPFGCKNALARKTGVCHAIIVHPPAGIAGGDHLTFQIETEGQAHAVITTPERVSGIEQMENRLSSIFI